MAEIPSTRRLTVRIRELIPGDYLVGMARTVIRVDEIPGRPARRRVETIGPAGDTATVQWCAKARTVIDRASGDL